MSKTYEALMLAERLRAAQDPAALARQLAEERESLSARLQVFQEQLEALAGKVEVTPAIDPNAVDSLRAELARLAAEQERQATTPQQQLEAAVQQWREELARQAVAFDDHAAALAEIRQQFAGLQTSISTTFDSLQSEVSQLRHFNEERLREEQVLRERLPAQMDRLRVELAHAHENIAAEVENRSALEERTEEQQQILSALATDISRRLEAALEDSRAAQQELGHRIAAAEASAAQERCAGELRLKGLVDKLRSSTETQQAEQTEQLDRMRAELAALLETRQHPSADLLERIEEAKTRADAAAQHAEAIAGEQASSITAVREHLANLQQEQTQLIEAVGSLKAHGPQALRLASELEALRQSLAAVQEVQQQQQEAVASLGRDQTAASTLTQRVTAIEQEHVPELARLQQQLVEAQSNQRALRDTVEGLPTVLAQKLASAEDLRSLSAQVTSVMEAQAQQRELATQVAGAHAAVDEAVRRVAAVEAAQTSSQTNTRQQIATLQTDGSALRKSLEALRLSLTRQLELAAEAEVDAVREQLAPLVDAQMRQERLAKEVQRAQTTADEAVRLAKIDKGYASGLATLKEQIAELLDDRVRQDRGIERRFELLCGIVDETIQHEKERMDHGISLFHEEAARRASELETKLARLEAYVAELDPGAALALEAEAKPKKMLTSVLSRRRPARKP